MIRRLIKEVLDEEKDRKIKAFILKVVYGLERVYENEEVCDPGFPEYKYLVERLDLQVGVVHFEGSEIYFDLNVKDFKIIDTDEGRPSESCRWQTLELIKPELQKLEYVGVTDIHVRIGNNGHKQMLFTIKLSNPGTSY
jgi:hypothetical protein